MRTQVKAKLGNLRKSLQFRCALPQKLLVLATVCCAPVYATIAQTNELVVLVLPFENLSSAKSMVSYEVPTSDDPDHPKRVFRVDRYSEAPRGILEDIIVQLGVKVVERQRVDSILLETSFGQFSGLVDTERAVTMGKMLGATALLMGTIEDVSTQTAKFSGYGVSTTQTTVRSRVRVRLIDIASGLVKYSTTVTGSATYNSSKFGGVTDSDVAYHVIAAALEKLREDHQFKQALVGAKSQAHGEEVTVQFTPVPDNCDIEIDGVYAGGSPAKIDLPKNKPVKVRITKSGYRPWEATILPREGLEVKPELARESTEKAK